MTRPRLPVVGAVMAVALLLRIPRLIARWHEDAWLYSVYPAQTLHKLETGLWHELPATFTGLHPPAWPVLHALTELVSPRPIWWLVESMGFSLGAVFLLARRAPLAALLLATAPVAVHYSAEVNQYALLTFALAGLWTAPVEADGRVQRSVLAWGVLAGWTHILGAVAAFLAVISLPRRLRWRTLGALGLGLLPLAPGVWASMVESSTFSQPGFEAGLVASDLVGRFGALGLGLPFLALFAVRREPRLALGVGGGFLVLVAFVALRVAAPHQFPYLLTLLPPLALCVASVPRVVWLVVPLAVVQTGWQLSFDGARVQAIVADVRSGERAIDVALDEVGTPWTCPDTMLTRACAGDAVVLLRPPGRNDDDKTRTSPVLWRIRPWWVAPRIHLPDVAPGSADHRHGQPRLVELPKGTFAVYVHDHVRPTLRTLYDHHDSVWIVVSDVGGESTLLHAAEDMVGRAAQRAGDDYLIR